MSAARFSAWGSSQELSCSGMKFKFKYPLLANEEGRVLYLTPWARRVQFGRSSTFRLLLPEFHRAEIQRRWGRK